MRLPVAPRAGHFSPKSTNPCSQFAPIITSATNYDFLPTQFLLCTCPFQAFLCKSRFFTVFSQTGMEFQLFQVLKVRRVHWHSALGNGSKITKDQILDLAKISCFPSGNMSEWKQEIFHLHWFTSGLKDIMVFWQALLFLAQTRVWVTWSSFCSTACLTNTWKQNSLRNTEEQMAIKVNTW